MLVAAVLAGPHASYGVFSVSIPLLRLLPNAIQYPDTGAEIGRRNIVEKFVSKFESSGTDSFNHSPGARLQVYCLATSIVRRVFASDPAFALHPMQQCNQRRFFNPKMRCDFGLSQWTW